LHKVLSDISGKTGLSMLRAIVDGQRDPHHLAALCHPNCKRPKQDFIDALTGYYKQEHLFILGQSLQTFDFCKQKLQACDEEVQRQLAAIPSKADKADLAAIPTRKRGNKAKNNQPTFDLRSELFALTGVDLTQVEGIDAVTAFTIISEQGADMSRFPSEKHFASHLGLCPNNQITGGRIRKRKTRKVTSRAANALRIAAQSLRRSQSALGQFYRRMHGRLGPAKAITATAHKLAKLIYRLLKHGEQYLPPDIGRVRTAASGHSSEESRKNSQESRLRTHRRPNRTRAFLAAAGPTECPSSRVRSPYHDVAGLLTAPHRGLRGYSRFTSAASASNSAGLSSRAM
jgi:hypothetical protein